MKYSIVCGVVGVMSLMAARAACAQKSVPAAPAANATARSFADSRYGVRFEVPAGWTLAHRDGEVSNFRLDVKDAPRGSLVRGVASMEFNPFPQSTLSSALLYFTVQLNSDEKSCVAPVGARDVRQETVGIGGMGFTHRHVEHGNECTETRDEIYTAYRRHACYRFDLEVNTFCSAASGAQELSEGQLHDVEARMAGILSTVTFSWETSGAQMVAVPDVAPVVRQPMKPGVR